MPLGQRRRVDVITVAPQTFTMVDYDAAQIAELAAQALQGVDGLGNDETVELVIDEDEATSRIAVTSVDPIALAVDGGAIEHYKEPRELGDLETRIACTRLFLEVVDRRNPGFGAPDLDAEVTQAHKQAWDVNLYGRVGRLGLRLHQPRFRYNFRNRHGFSDNADRIFDELWSTDGLTWARIVELSDQATDTVQRPQT